MADHTSSIDPDACYRALTARDARFDGRFFTGVTSTGIYCRPVCSVRTPRRENCRFFSHAAKAESAGFRPCLRCRPELAPGTPWWSIQDASAILAHQAARLLDEPDTWLGADVSVQALATRLGVSDRHLRRIFEAQFGVAPLQYLQTRRLLAAKQMLADTDLPIGEVAIASGFGSVRRFNAAFVAHYKLNPTQLRRAGTTPVSGAVRVQLGYRPPLDAAALGTFFRQRQIDGVEQVTPCGTGAGFTFGRTIAWQVGAHTHAGWLHARVDPGRCCVELQVCDALRPLLPLVIRRVRHWFDLDADPDTIHQLLGTDFPHGEGLRVPGTLDGFELAVRAVLGQQITVAAARTLAQRLVLRFGAPIATAYPGLNRLFPDPTQLAAADADALGTLGIVRQRQRAIQALARAVAGGQLQLSARCDIPATLAQLTALPGIGDWTAQYIAMRALRWPDAFPSGDIALHKALGLRDAPHPARAAQARSQAWRPWRSYAVIRAWHITPTGERSASTEGNGHAARNRPGLD
jgi:AraC family transcriptional regulator of adaptative response / DNA-3-methyladenine glycosylase II